jgi:hypothetical protein
MRKFHCKKITWEKKKYHISVYVWNYDIIGLFIIPNNEIHEYIFG